jgi:hypothetical protein
MSTNKPGVVVYTYNPSCEGKRSRRIAVQGQTQAKSTKVYLKVNQSRKWAECIVQVTEHLPHKCVALCSNPSTAKKEKESKCSVQKSIPAEARTHT